MITFKKAKLRMWSRLGPCGAFGIAMDELASQDDNIVVATADLGFFSGLERFKRNHPQNYYNLGIAEQNMIGVAAGMASEGCNVFATTYAAFAATRCSDQVRVNMAYMQLPIKLIGLTAGLSAGILGATHMSFEDIAIMRAMPNLTILSPADCAETVKAVFAAAEHNGPVYLRLTGSMNTPMVYDGDFDYIIGKAIELEEGCDIVVIATGSALYPAKKAIEKLKQDDISCGLIDMHTIKPLDTELLNKIAKQYQMIITIEEHSRVGGLGAAIAEHFANDNRIAINMIGLPDRYSHAGDYAYLMEQSGLSVDGIYHSIKEFAKGA